MPRVFYNTITTAHIKNHTICPPRQNGEKKLVKKLKTGLIASVK